MRTAHKLTVAIAVSALFSAQAINAAPPTVTAVSVDSVTGNVIVTGTCTPNVSGTAQVKIHFVDASGASHAVKKIRCPASGNGSTKVKPPFIDLVTGTALPSGTYQVCLKQLSNSNCWASPISF
ncbi:MAG: hypothetical protein ABL914_10715 [Novosphingobium sp.]|uniref:hypothetical protein n=1 Tax=Novosphingobium sp. TaxID=1874826 RepID=UPI0032BC97C3